jgi:hypothetical protein
MKGIGAFHFRSAMPPFPNATRSHRRPSAEMVTACAEIVSTAGAGPLAKQAGKSILKIIGETFFRRLYF